MVYPIYTYRNVTNIRITPDASLIVQCLETQSVHAFHIRKANTYRYSIPWVEEKFILQT